MRRNFRGNKYKARATVVDGVRFDSKKEAMRWQELRQLEAAGVIRDLKRQVSIPLEVCGIKVATYRADFMYKLEGHTVVEDAKGYQTDTFKLKWKIAQAMHPIWRFVIS